MRTFLIFLCLFGILALADLIWLSLTTKGLYKAYLGHLFTDRPKYLFAAIFYFLYPVGLLYFVALPHLAMPSNFLEVFLSGALFGLIAYATYNLTNAATLRDWPFWLSLIDMGWGAFASAVTSSLTWLIFRAR